MQKINAIFTMWRSVSMYVDVLIVSCAVCWSTPSQILMTPDSTKKRHTRYTYTAVLSFSPLLLQVYIGPASNDTDRTLHPNGKCHDVGTFWLSSIPNRGAGCMEPVKNVILPPYQLKPVICNKHCVAADTNLLQTYGAYKSGGFLHQSGSSTLIASEKGGSPTPTQKLLTLHLKHPHQFGQDTS